ncbi:ATP-binding protein [Sphingobacterium sp. Mn56C]|uniref:ATP-binding protein n=1 Tax=Sphingobacterium sp. Mn56C TaxID=3395261 RepID=UPI003BE6D07E
MKKTIDNPYYDKAYEFLDKGIVDSSFLYFNLAKNLFIDAKDSLNTANCLINMSITQKDYGDYFGAQESALQAIEYLNKKNPNHFVYLSTNYNNLGVSSLQLKDYQNAISFFQEALTFSTDSLNSIIYRSNIALSYQKLGFFMDAIQMYKKELEKVPISSKEYVRILSNIARTKWLEDSTYHAAPEFYKTLYLRQEARDLVEESTSYFFLSTYYENSKPDSAIYFLEKFYEISKKIQNSDDQIVALGKLISLSSNQKKVKHYFETYRNLTDSVQQARTAAKNQFALIRYEVDKNKAENLRLQNENKEKENRIILHRVIIGAVTLVFLLFVAGVGFWYKKKKERISLETQHKIKASQLKTSRKIHDVVANGLYRVMSEIEYKRDIDRGSILDKLEDMYHKSRDISYEAQDLPKVEQPINEQIADLLKSFANETHRVLIAGNESEFYKGIRKAVIEEIKQVLQELMVNMKKHSQAKNVVIKFERTCNQLVIFYKDNGVGMGKDVIYGNGLTSTGNRIESISGQINFVSEVGKGLTVEIKVPIS